MGPFTQEFLVAANAYRRLTHDQANQHSSLVDEGALALTEKNYWNLLADTLGLAFFNGVLFDCPYSNR